MRLFAGILVFLFLFSSTVFSQSGAQSDSLAQKAARDIWVARNEQMRVDILRDIDALEAKDQVEYMARLGSVFWSQDKKYAGSLFTRSVEIALSPAADYKTSREKLDSLIYLLFARGIFKADQMLSKKLLAKITEIAVEEVKTKGSDDYSQTLFYLAEQLFKKDEQAAFNFLLLSLSGKKPYLSCGTLKFYSAFKLVNQNLADQYAAKLLELAKKQEDKALVGRLLAVGDFCINLTDTPYYFSEAQRKDSLNMLTPFLQIESEIYFRNKKSSCELTAKYGGAFLQTYQALLPQKSAFIEKSLNICQIKNTSVFRPRKIGTVEELLELAKKSTDIPQKTNFLLSAVSIADSKKNYQLAVSILESIDNSEQKNGYLWPEQRIKTGSKLILQLLDSNNFAGAAKEIEKSPQSLRPFILIDVVDSYVNNTTNRQFSLDLLNQARTELSKMNFLQPTGTLSFYQANPARFRKMVNLYIRAGEPNEALKTFEKFIDIQNHLSNHYTYQNKSGETFSYYYFESFFGNFLNANFERIYQSTERIDSRKIRLEMRIDLLQSNMVGSTFKNGMIQIS